jgi:hypothetical protein
MATMVARKISHTLGTYAPEPKNGFVGQNQYNRVTYPSIGNFTWSMKIYTFGGQKGKYKVSELENGTQAPKYQK